MHIMHQSKIAKFTLFDNSFYMKAQALLHLFNFENCIDHMHNWLCESSYLVNEKFKRFETVLQRNNITTVCDAEKRYTRVMSLTASY